MTDIMLQRTGGVVGLLMRTPAAMDWAHATLGAAEWRWLGRTLWVGPQDAPAIVEQARESGLAVKQL